MSRYVLEEDIIEEEIEDEVPGPKRAKSKKAPVSKKKQVLVEEMEELLVTGEEKSLSEGEKE